MIQAKPTPFGEKKNNYLVDFLQTSWSFMFLILLATCLYLVLPVHLYAIAFYL